MQIRVSNRLHVSALMALSTAERPSADGPACAASIAFCSLKGQHSVLLHRGCCQYWAFQELGSSIAPSFCSAASPGFFSLSVYVSITQGWSTAT